MLADSLAALLGLLDALGPAFTQPSLRNAVVIFAGWVLTNGQHAVTQALVATDVAGKRHHEAFHRFFSRGTWNPDDVGRLLFEHLMRFLPPGVPVGVAIDDKLAIKKGPEVFGLGSLVPWQTCTALLYGQRRAIFYKTLCAQWYRACGGRLLRIVVVRVDNGRVPWRVFFSTDPDLSVIQILECYASRWSIEVCFRDMKQLLGFADSSDRAQAAVERTAPFVGYVYTTLVIGFLDGIHASELASPPLRPWYSHKEGLCFADVLRAAQRTLAPLNVLDPARSLDILRKHPANQVDLPLDRRKRAA